jgi:hypothetical protein
MFKRYADLFSDEERKAKQQATQQRRREWKAAQAENALPIPTGITGTCVQRQVIS